MKTLYLEQVGGVSGDMFLGVLISLGVKTADLEAGLMGLGIPGLRLEARDVERQGLRAVQAMVLADEIPILSEGHRHGDKHSHEHNHEHNHEHSHEHSHEYAPNAINRNYSDIVSMIRGAGLPSEVVTQSVAVFTRLGEAEAHEHGVPLDAVHFHEVGAADSIADIVGVCLGLHLLKVGLVMSSPFLFGSGRVDMAHGSWPVPAPAAVRLTVGHPVQFTGMKGETVTPTGAALVVTLAGAVGEFPAMSLEAIGVGAGSRDWPDRPNVLRGFLGEGHDDRYETDEIEVLTTTMDDVTPEVVGGLAEALMGSGALDISIIPVQMKKGRPGFRVEVLVSPDRAESLADRLFRESPTIGIRRRREKRWVLNRSQGAVQLPWGRVSVKIVTFPDGSRRIKPEYEDCRLISLEHSIPIMEVMRLASCAEVQQN